MIKKLFERANRGILLDVVVFIVNVVSMTILSRQLASLFHEAKTDRFALAAVAVFFLGLAFLQPIGAILKRRGAHRRKPELHQVPQAGCVFLPAYFLTQLIFLIISSRMIVDLLLGKGYGPPKGDFTRMPGVYFPYFLFGLPGLAIINTFILWFYFRSPNHQSLFEFLESPQAETLGDVILFLNMICYLAYWGMVMARLPNNHPTISVRLILFAFLALLIYFPPRLLYLAEDYKRPVVWLTMVLANSPVLLRILFVASEWR
jgi:hypothetical protein